MAYERQTWSNGDLITADKLNHMEEGIAESVAESNKIVLAEYTITSVDNYSGTCNMSYDEIVQLLQSKTPVLMVWAQKPSESSTSIILGGANLVSYSTGVLEFSLNGYFIRCRNNGYNWTDSSSS